VKAALFESGIDPALLERAQAPDVKAALIANTEDAVARGAFGIPTFFVDEEIFFGKDRLRDVEEAIHVAMASA
jgi:2-hydroxychromene-2-carboxylate isomerase